MRLYVRVTKIIIWKLSESAENVNSDRITFFDGKVPVATLCLHCYCYIRWWISVIPHYRLKSCRVTVNAILCEFQVSRLRIMLFTLTWPCTHQSIHHDVTTPVRPGKPRLFVSCPNSTALVDPNQGSL